MATNSEPLLKQFSNANFIEMDEQGVHANLAKLESSTQFCQFFDGFVAAGYYFKGLDYPAFLSLISRYTPKMLATHADVSINKIGKIRLAASIERFEPVRQALYRNPLLEEDSAEYLFEPVTMPHNSTESSTQSPQEGQIKTTLDFDEFVTAMWPKGLRYGIDETAVRNIIKEGRFTRLIIAHSTKPTPSQDAKLQELDSTLHRDDAPLRRPDGAVDLRHFGNRFPQVKAGDRLMQKVPGVPGQPGFNLLAEPIDPPPPEDFDLTPLAGEGTSVAKTAEGEFLIASTDGFLNIDAQSSRISVTEKIINYSGVSLKTTGDIILQGDYYEEHGEIQEKRVVRGKNITVMANVFGEIISSGGTIWLRQNLVGGAASNEDGDIYIEGLTSNAIVISKKGRITLNHAENVVIVGNRVEIDNAINCCIAGESVMVNTSLGSQIAGKQIRIEQARERRHIPTMVSILLPDLSKLAASIHEMRLHIKELTSQINALRSKHHAIIAIPDIRNYLAITNKLQRKELVLNEKQQANLIKVKQRITPSLKEMAVISQQIQALNAEQKELAEQAAHIRHQSKLAIATVGCHIDHLTDETLIRKLRINWDELLALPARDLKLTLQEPGLPEERLHAQHEPYTWHAH